MDNENKYLLQVELGDVKYSVSLPFGELIKEVERKFGEEIRNEIMQWVLTSKPNDETKYGIHIVNLG